MSEQKSFITEIVFYAAIFMATVLKLLDVHFITKEFGVYTYFIIAAIILFFIRSVYLQKDIKRKNRLLILIPIIALVSMNIFVVVGGVFLSFGVFSKYERTQFNKRIKIFYGVFVLFSFIIFFVTVISSVGFNESFARYEGYEISPDARHVVTIIETGEFDGEKSYSYKLEEVYFKLFMKEKYVVVKLLESSASNVEWVSNEDVKIKETVHTIK